MSLGVLAVGFGSSGLNLKIKIILGGITMQVSFHNLVSKAFIAAALFFGLSSFAAADAFKLGAASCGGECHEAELEVWEGSPHNASFEKFDDPSDELTEKVDAILAAVGEEDMTESAVCTNCHFTMIQETADEEPFADSGPSCESCHGAGSEFRDIHSDQDVDYDTRMANAEAAGMIRPNMKFEIAQNCNDCHAMARPEVDGATIAKMIDAGHPIKTTFELVQYSQGSVRHRFYPPDTSVNAEMTQQELAALYVEGQVAQLLAAHKGLKKNANDKYKAAMQTRLDNAKAGLAGVDGSAAFIGSPTLDSAKALVDSIQGKDMTGAVGDKLPDPSTYKE